MARDFISHAEAVRKRVNAQLLRNLKSASIFAVRAAKANLSVGGASGFKTSHGGAGLKGQMGYEIDASLFKSRVGNNLAYSRVHEGGTVGKGGMLPDIRPKSAKALAVPIHPDAKKARGPRDFPDLVFIPGRGKPPILARIRSGGAKRARQASMDVMYVLLKSVAIPPRPYLRPALTKNRAAITKLLLRPIPPTVK